MKAQERPSRELPSYRETRGKNGGLEVRLHRELTEKTVGLPDAYFQRPEGQPILKYRQRPRQCVGKCMRGVTDHPRRPHEPREGRSSGMAHACSGVTNEHLENPGSNDVSVLSTHDTLAASRAWHKPSTSSRAASVPRELASLFFGIFFTL